jgi:hypothetical protein
MKSFPRASLLLAVCILAAAPQAHSQTVSIPTAGLNGLVLEQIDSMPLGGGYATTHSATVRLQSSAQFESGKLLITPAATAPTYCSGATYLVFLKVIQELLARQSLQLDPDTLEQLLFHGQPDGQGIWGRWNANGPGTARLFRELGLGPNFTSLDDARPGDFMKIFWTPEVGSAEHGHSVIFLGVENRAGVDCVQFWSSNKPDGYGKKTVPLTRISHMIFSRLENPVNLSRIRRIPSLDPYLASLQTKRSSFEEAGLKCGF